MTEEHSIPTQIRLIPVYICLRLRPNLVRHLSVSGGVFGSSARNDRTSALKAAFQVFIRPFLSALGSVTRQGHATVTPLSRTRRLEKLNQIYIFNVCR